LVQSDSDSAAGVREGDVLAGKYRVERVLGIGGMGVVVAAHHLQLDEKVALKFLLPSMLGNQEAVSRFTREARAAVKIKSEHVARVTDVGALPNGAPYMVMEYLEGGDLGAWLEQRGALPIEQAVEFVLQACVAIADAHALGIVHRDLKPANLFCVRRSDGQLSIKVLDFGISKVTAQGASASAPGMAFTKTSALMGSPFYMSPEQLQSSKVVDARTDTWALGVILFELMTRRTPFVGDSVTELAIKIATDPTPAVRSLRAEVPAGLEAVISRCLEKEPRQRYGNVAELALALLPFGPKRAKALVERISGIIQASGLSASALDLPPSPPVAETKVSAGTLPALGRTTVGRTLGTTRAVGVALASLVIVTTCAALVILSKRPLAPYEVRTVGSPTVGPSPTVLQSDPLVPSLKTLDTTRAETAPAVMPQGVAARVQGTGVPKKNMPVNGPAPEAPHVATTGAGAVPVTRTGSPNCDPPYYFDGKGNRIYKRDCM
jgi:serine/threonine-protein kinase